MSAPMSKAANKASTSNEQSEAGLQKTDDGASTTTATRSSTRQSTSASVAGQRELRSSAAASSAPGENSSSSSRTATPNKDRVTFSSIVNPPKKKAEKAKSSQEAEEEEEMPSTSRVMRAQRSTTTAFTKESLLDHVKKLPQEAEETRKRSADAELKGATKRRRGETSHSLEEALTKAILVKPYFIDVEQGEDGASSDESNESPIVPVRELKSEDLPGIAIWNETSYKELGFSKKKTDEVEMFQDREVERIVAYVNNKPKPFVLVQLALKRNEKTIRVQEVVQAVDCDLAHLLFKNTFDNYEARRKQSKGEETERPMDEETDEAPTGSASSSTPSARPRRGTKN